MTDKEKIREDVSKLIIPESECNGMSLMEKGRQYAYREVLGIIDSLQEEPVSEDFEEAARSYSNNLDNIYGSIGEQTKNAFKAGAKWQEEKDNEEKVLTYRHGFNDCKEQMMAKAVDGGCFSYKNGYIHISCDIDERITDIKLGDKVKVIVIKEN